MSDSIGILVGAFLVGLVLGGLAVGHWVAMTVREMEVKHHCGNYVVSDSVSGSTDFKWRDEKPILAPQPPTQEGGTR